MGPHSNMFIRIVIFVYLSRQAVVSRTSNFMYKKDELLNVSHYLTSSKCKTAIQCAVACFSLPDCGLADLDSGNLYKKVQAHSLETTLIKHYVESRENNGNEHDPEAENVTQSGSNNIRDENISKETEHLLVVKPYGPSHRDVFKVSLTSKTTEKTGITLRKNIRSIVYDRKSNTFFWSDDSGIFKQVLEFNSTKRRLSSEEKALDLNICNEKLVYRMRYRGESYIYTHDHVKSQDKDLFLSMNTKLTNLVVDSNMACWFQCSAQVSINCFDMSTIKSIYAHSLSRRCGARSSMALLKTSNYGLLVFIDKGGQGTYCINVVEITARGRFLEAQTVRRMSKAGHMEVAPGLLVYSFLTSDKVVIWQMSHNGTLGKIKFRPQFPFKSTGLTVLIALL